MTSASLRLRREICWCTIQSLPEWSTFPARLDDDDAKLAAIAEAGWTGVQGADPNRARHYGLIPSMGGRIVTANDVDALARRMADLGIDYVALHVGNGLEDDSAADRFAEAIIAAADRHRVRLLVETHRATMTQDMWRTVKLVERHPDLRFTGDFSHWYTGQEMRYGGAPIAPKLDFIMPVIERVVTMHGRIGNGSSMQIAIDPERDRTSVYLTHWQELWGRVFQTVQGRLTELPIAIELLPAANHYARTFPNTNGQLVEESDRWQQAAIIATLADTWLAAGIPQLQP